LSHRPLGAKQFRKTTWQRHTSRLNLNMDNLPD
jgi:hypothetical protein